MSNAILFVDDEPNVLAGLERQLRRRYTVKTAVGGQAGLAALDKEGPFAVVVSDMRMPEMNGAQFLAEVCKRHPDTVRLLLTGYAEVQAAIDAVNHGGLFRFLTKPCDSESLSTALDAALAQYRLITAERELLDRTLRGSVQVLGEVLALVNPTAFGRALRVQGFARELAQFVGSSFGWELEVAAILSFLGYVGVSEQILALAERGKDLTAAEQAELDAAPRHTIEMIARIPRLDRVIEIIRHLGSGADTADSPFGARLLRLARDLDGLLGRGMTRDRALEMLKSNQGRYDPNLLADLERFLNRGSEPESRVVPTAGLLPGMVLDEDLIRSDGTLLLRHGNAITAPMMVRLDLLTHSGQIPPKIRILIPRAVK